MTRGRGDPTPTRCRRALSASGQFLPVLFDVPLSRAGGLVFGVSVVSFLATPVGLLVVGYWAGTRTDVAAEHGGLLVPFAVVGGATVLGYLAVVGLTLGDLFSGGPLQILFGVGYDAVVQAVNFAITGFAGPGLAQFRGG